MPAFPGRSRCSLTHTGRFSSSAHQVRGCSCEVSVPDRVTVTGSNGRHRSAAEEVRAEAANKLAAITLLTTSLQPLLQLIPRLRLPLAGEALGFGDLVPSHLLGDFISSLGKLLVILALSPRRR